MYLLGLVLLWYVCECSYFFLSVFDGYFVKLREAVFPEFVMEFIVTGACETHVGKYVPEVIVFKRDDRPHYYRREFRVVSLFPEQVSEGSVVFRLLFTCCAYVLTFTVAYVVHLDGVFPVVPNVLC